MNTKRIIAVVVILAVAGIARADFTFGPPQNLGPVVNTGNEGTPALSPDALTLYFSGNFAGGAGKNDLWYCTRPTVNDPWGPPVSVGAPVNTAAYEMYPCVSPDNLTLYFGEFLPTPYRAGGLGTGDLWMAARASPQDPWGEPVNLGPNVNSAEYLESCPALSQDGLTLIFAVAAPTMQPCDLWMSTRPSIHDPWGPRTILKTSDGKTFRGMEPALSADGLALFFTNPDVAGMDLWMSLRQSPKDLWDPPVSLGPTINTDKRDNSPSLSPNMKTLYFCASQRPGGLGGADLWQVDILPVVDFNADGKVDNQDLLRLVESWGKDDPLVDIGPGPWGDGKVDIEDLKVFMTYWEKENPPQSDGGR